MSLSLSSTLSGVEGERWAVKKPRLCRSGRSSIDEAGRGESLSRDSMLVVWWVGGEGRRGWC